MFGVGGKIYAANETAFLENNFPVVDFFYCNL